MNEPLPPAAFLGALAALPGMGPARLAALLAGRTPEAAWAAVRAGAVTVAPAVTVGRWREVATTADVGHDWARLAAAGVEVLAPSDPRWPSALTDDPEPPELLYARGDVEVLDAPRVAVIGTRRCTVGGREVARELGEDLATAGVCVVSGLALGIDGAAHVGALGATGGAAPAAVVASGLDIVYPRRHGELWQAVADRGVVLSEYPLGVAPERWRFPARNRIIAALADVVVVVESHDAGGSMHTVESALERGRTVMAVPGSVRSPASAGTNALLAAGSPPARDAADVLAELGLDRAAWARRAAPPSTTPSDALLDAFDGRPRSLEELAEHLDLELPAVARRLVELEATGAVASRGGWWERVR